MATMHSWLVVFVLLGTAQSIRFKLSPDSRKCIKDEVHKDVLVLGQYELSAAPMQKTDISVSYCACHMGLTSTVPYSPLHQKVGVCILPAHVARSIVSPYVDPRRTTHTHKRMASMHSGTCVFILTAGPLRLPAHVIEYM